MSKTDKFGRRRRQRCRKPISLGTLSTACLFFEGDWRSQNFRFCGRLSFSSPQPITTSPPLVLADTAFVLCDVLDVLFGHYLYDQDI